MKTASRRRTAWAIAASALAHVAVLIVAALQRPMLPLPLDEAAGPAQAVIPIMILPRTALPAAGRPAPSNALRLHRQPRAAGERPLPIAPLAVARTPGASSEPSQTPGAAAVGPSGPDLRLALRHGVLGCANLAGLSRAEREHCEEQLGRGAAQAPQLAIALEPRIRAYYDAVALAKKPDGPLTRIGIQSGGNDMFATDPRGVTGHPPLIGCRIPFGPGKPRKLPSHWLTLGPCFIAPPKGPFSVEADITPPDQDTNPR